VDPSSEDELERRIQALNDAIEKSDFERASRELKACDLDQLIKSQSVSPRVRGMIDRALGVAVRVRAAKEAELKRVDAEVRARNALAYDDKPAAPPAFLFRAAAPSDQPTVIALLQELFDEVAPGEIAAQSKTHLERDISAALAAPHVRIFLAEHGREPAGLLRVDVLTIFPTFRLREDHRCGYVDQMFVRPAFRNRKLGRQLMQLCEEWVRGQGVAYCMLHAAHKALGFYTAGGYQSTRELFKKL
jgi:GNAT superfamily N-acetyltransferase